MLRKMTGRQYVEQQLYLRHVGQLGPARWDFYNARAALYSVGSSDHDWPDFMPVWPAEAEARALGEPGPPGGTGRKGAPVTVRDNSSDEVKAARLAAMAAAAEAEATAPKPATTG